MAKNKTTETKNSVSGYVTSIKDDKRRSDCSSLIEFLSVKTGHEPKMWGTSIVGFGSYHYKYDSGHEGDAPVVGLSSRANAITLYLPNMLAGEALLKKLGKHKAGKGCVYIRKLEDIDTATLAVIVKNSVEYIRSKYPG
jgi:hypothetical protein